MVAIKGATGNYGSRARVQVSTLAASRRGRRVVLLVVSIGLLPALAACSAFSSSPPNASSAVAGQFAPSGSAPAVANAAAASSVPTYTSSTSAVVGTGYASADQRPSPPLRVRLRKTQDQAASSSILLQIRSPALCNTAAAQSPPGNLHTLRTDAAAPPPRTYAPSAPPAVAGTGYASAAAAVTTTSGPPAEDTGPSGLLVNLFRFQFDAARGAVEHAAPAEHLYRLGAALHAAAWSARRTTAPAAAKLRAVIAPRPRGSEGWARAPSSSSRVHLASLLHWQRSLISFDQVLRLVRSPSNFPRSGRTSLFRQADHCRRIRFKRRQEVEGSFLRSTSQWKSVAFVF